MGRIAGSPSAARELADKIIKDEKQLLQELTVLDKKIKDLKHTCRDDEIMKFEQMTNRILVKLQEALPATAALKKQLDRYAETLERAIIQQTGRGVLYGNSPCGVPDTFGVQAGSVSYADASGAQQTMRIDADGLKQQMTQASSGEEREKLRALSELLALKDTMDLQPEKSTGLQMAGLYGDLKTTGHGYEAHHMPPKSVIDCDMDQLPCILLPESLHRKTASYGGRIRKKTVNQFLPDDRPEAAPYKEELTEQLVDGNYADAVRNEIYEIKQIAGSAMDGALSQFIDCMVRFYAEKGVPKAKFYKN